MLRRIVVICIVLACSRIAFSQQNPDLSKLKLLDRISVRFGDKWLGAQVIKIEDKSFLVQYDDNSTESVTSDRIQPGNPKNPLKSLGPDQPVKVMEVVRQGQNIPPAAPDGWKVKFEELHQTLGQTFAFPPRTDFTNTQGDDIRFHGGMGIITAHSTVNKQSTAYKISVGGNKGIVSLGTTYRGIDISPNGNVIAARTADSQSKNANQLVFFNLVTSLIESINGFVPSKNASKVLDANFVDDQNLLVLTADEIGLWEYAKASCNWSIATKCKTMTISPNLKCVAVSTTEGVIFIEISSGKVMGIAQGAVPEQMSFSLTSKKLYGLADNILSIWDMSQGNLLQQIGLQKELTGNLQAIDDQYVVIGHHIYSPEKLAPLRRMDNCTILRAGNGTFWTIVIDSGKKIKQQWATLYHSALPPAFMDNRVKSQKPSETILKPGGSVSLDVQIDGDENLRKQITDNLTRQLAAANIKIEANQPVRIVARFDDKMNATLSIQKGKIVGWEVSSYFLDKSGKGDQRTLEFATQPIPTLVAFPTDISHLKTNAWESMGVRDH